MLTWRRLGLARRSLSQHVRPEFVAEYFSFLKSRMKAGFCTFTARVGIKSLHALNV